MDASPEVIIIPTERQKSLRTAPKMPPKQDDRHAAYIMLIEQGIEPMRAAATLGYHPRTAYALNKKMNAYEKKKDHLLKQSVSSLDKIIQGKPVGGEKVIDKETGEVKMINQVIPNSSTVMRGIECVMDREVPKVNVNANLNIPFEPVDLDKYR